MGLSAGEGSKGPRLYEWTWLQLAEQSEGGHERGRWIVIRRHLTDPSKRAYYRVAAPATTTLPELVRVAGSRWKIEEGLEEAKGEVGLDQYEGRGLRAWYRFVTLALLAHAILVVVGAKAPCTGKKSGAGRVSVRLSVAELRRLLHLLREPEEQRGTRLWWSRFRRSHQAKARACYKERRARQAPPVSGLIPEAIRLPGLPTLTDAQWERLRPLLPAQKPRTGRPATDHRLIVEGMLWVVRTGSSWRELPERFGPWSSVAERSYRWCRDGKWALILQVLQQPNTPISSST